MFSGDIVSDGISQECFIAQNITGSLGRPYTFVAAYTECNTSAGHFRKFPENLKDYSRVLDGKLNRHIWTRCGVDPVPIPM